MSTDKVCPNCAGRPDLYMDVMSGNGPGSGTCTCDGTGKAPANHEAEELDNLKEDLFQLLNCYEIDAHEVHDATTYIGSDEAETILQQMMPKIVEAITQQRTAAEQAGYERRGREDVGRLEALDDKIRPGHFKPCGVCAQRDYQHTCDQMLDTAIAALQPTQSGEKL